MIPMCFDSDGFKKTRNYVELMKTVIEYSKCSQIDIAVCEWSVISRYKEEDGVTCLCGHEDCKYVYVIKNLYNLNELSPIGSECMKYFEWNEQEAKIFKAFEKWHYKKYHNPGSIYDQVEFHKIIKDVEYVRGLERCKQSAEHKRLLEYASAVWVHNPPPPPSLSLLQPSCQKCLEQQKKGYKKCYNCFTKKSPKPICGKCEEQKKKGFLWCYVCYKEKL
jgi:hypothetical protein